MMMKIQCNACEAAEANVLCCAEEAALCWACDHKIHATSKLASEHHRLPLSSSSPFPNCDICQGSLRENLNRPAQKSSEQGPSRAGGVRSKAAFAGQMGGDGAAATSKSNSI
ncbi:hypothetical protein TIFTF001_024005 [Ficus carica]|uniref:B box-type domain-containing protein n=1 Tax=Ficus carica TaxID=3494 RepID=A0AA88ALF4_FICCA|nr:hypothetical protein TIFTF001_024005 [Ficus carica]